MPTLSYKKTTLKNGAKVIIAPMENTRAVTVLVLVRTGSKYETRKNNGVSHFLEHMFFKGTDKRPRAVDISSLLDGVGGEFNAFTSEEFTGYYVKVATSHFDLALDVVSDILLHSKFDTKEVNRERGVIMEEINMNNDNPMRKVLELWGEALYGDQPAGWPVAGTKETVAGITREDIVEYFGRQYVGDSIAIIVAGNTNNRDVLRDIKKYFSPLKKGSPQDKIKVIVGQEKPRALLYTKKTDQTHIVLGTRLFSTFDPRKYTAQVMATILGGGMSSRMFISVRERKGLVYYISSTADLDTDAGSLFTRAGIDNKKVELAVKTIVSEYKRLKMTKVSPKELDKAKNYIRGRTYLGLEASDDVAEFLGGQEIIEKNILSPDEILENIDKVSSGEIQDLASEIFVPEKMNLALVGPFEDKEKFEELLSGV